MEKKYIFSDDDGTSSGGSSDPVTTTTEPAPSDPSPSDPNDTIFPGVGSINQDDKIISEVILPIEPEPHSPNNEITVAEPDQSNDLTIDIALDSDS